MKAGLFIILAWFTSSCHGNSAESEHASIPAPSLARKLGVGLAPTPVPYEPPGFKPTTTPTDRTKKPTRRPTRKPFTRAPTLFPECSLCKPGENPFRPQTKIYYKGALQTCAYIDSLGSLSGSVPPGDCQYYRLNGATTCLCQPGTPPVTTTCSLCEDGSPLPNPDKRVLDQIRCSTFEASSLSDVKANCVKYQGGIGVYCGCNNPIASPKACRLCPYRKRLPEPNRKVDSVTCIEHEFSANFGNNCAAMREKYAEECCATPV